MKKNSKERLNETVLVARLRERRERLEAMAEGRKQRAQTFKSKKDYNRKNKDWKNET
jgi:hypothetical protein